MLYYPRSIPMKGVQMSQRAELVMVYNADSGFLAALKDLAYKNIRPSTYQCQLCALTYSNLGMKGKWRKFIDSLDMDVTFLHKDELEEKLGIMDAVLPIVYMKKDNRLEQLIGREEMEACSSLDELISLVKEKLGEV